MDKKALISLNRKATFNFNIHKKYEVGIMLQGSEVKSLRLNQISLQNSYARFEGKNALFLYDCHIPIYANTTQHTGHIEPLRPRKLLMHARELRQINALVKKARYTLVPLDAYFKNKRYVKLTIALATGKKNYDKKAAIKARDAKRTERREEL